VFLSGNIADLQARMNAYNLVEGGKISDPDLKAFAKLFEVLGLPPAELDLLASNLLQSQAIGTPAKPVSPLTPLPPQRVEHLAWLGLSAPTLVALEPFIIWLPQRTTVNINTASVTVLYASSPRMDMARAQALANTRKAAHFKTLDDANKLIGTAADPLVDAHHSVNSRYFLVKGRQRQDQTVVQQQSVVYRDGLDVKTLWRTNVAPPLGESTLQ
jgi:general secretion pathway protein K